MDDQPLVQVRFTVTEEGRPSFTDALYVPLAEYDDLVASGGLEVLKRERFEAWCAELDAPAPEPEPAPGPAVLGVDAARQILADALAQLDAVGG